MKKQNYNSSHYSYVNKDFDKEKYLEDIKRRYARYLTSEKKVLDIGCGEGHLLEGLERLGITKLHGIERDDGQCQKAKKRCPSATISIGDAHTVLKKTSEKYDVIFLIDVIEHVDVDKIHDFLMEVRKHMTQNGWIIIRTPSAESPLFGTRMRYIDATHKVAYTRESVSQVLRDSGLEKFEIKSSNVYKKKITDLGIIGRTAIELCIKSILALYLGKEAFKLIFTPNMYIYIQIEQKKD